MSWMGENSTKRLLELTKQEFDKKADKNQGTSNAGKYWKVGDDGNLTLQKLEEGGVSVDYDVSKEAIVFSDTTSVSGASLPAGGTAGQVLKTNGAGGTYWDDLPTTSGSGESDSAGITLVWDNSANCVARAEFAAQTVSVDLSGYTAVLIEYAPTAGYSSRICQEFVIGSTGCAFAIAYNDGSDASLDTGALCYDRLVKPTTTGLQFYDCNVNSTTVLNKCLYPTRVYGIR